ncbi:hypothetical protein [Chryseosolibacter indicus]|uniref:Uncharacterized protein n=1 Tax=Chryseosolibacter indicus TaxID=2782351 RepID=A0ABS5VTJ2_9BACT|nr:hypothetical protein [Chryseosolibacter indicus]MBT1704742.1 hypothetical protein [Chryseosolibacter indicus]
MVNYINQPYKIVTSKQKRYEAHYKIPAGNVVVIPVRELGEEVLCDIRWEDSNGELQVIHHAMFIKGNLTPLNAMLDIKLFDIWSAHYKSLVIQEDTAQI